MTVRDDIEDERRALAYTFEAVGPSAATLCGDWTALDLAAHVTSLERQAGVVTFLGRSLVARGVRLNDRAPGLADRVVRRERRRGFETFIERLRRPSPRLLLRPRLGAVGLFEVWMHHEDVAAPNDREHAERDSLDDVITWLLRYQATQTLVSGRLVASNGREWGFGRDSSGTVVVQGSLGDLARWLAGRPVRTPLEFDGDEGATADLDAFRPHV
jgi:uncharacterized protein (TIGR03083 family)